MEEQTAGVALINFPSSSGVIGCLASGVEFFLPAPFKAFFTVNDAQGSSHFLVLCQLLIAHTYEFIVEGAFLDNDKWDMNLLTSRSVAGLFGDGEFISILNCLN